MYDQKAQPYLDDGLNINFLRESRELNACGSNHNDITKGGYKIYYYEATTAGISRNATVFYTTGIQYKWEARDAFTNDVAKEGYVWIDHGDSVFTIDGLPPSQYVVSFTAYELGADPVSSPCLLTATRTMVADIARLDNTNQGFSRDPTETTACLVRQWLLRPFITSLSSRSAWWRSADCWWTADLTMLGIKGNINLLRPTDGSGPITSFNLTSSLKTALKLSVNLGGSGPSPFLGDLVNT